MVHHVRPGDESSVPLESGAALSFPVVPVAYVFPAYVPFFGFRTLESIKFKS